MSDSAIVQEEELHAYVDRRLDPERHEAVQRYLAEHAEAAARIAAYEAQRAVLRQALEPLAEAPIPPQLNLARLIEQRLPRRPKRWMQAAALLLALGLGAGGGWTLHDALIAAAPAGLAAFAEEAASSHLIYVSDLRRPVELWAPQRADMARWLSNRLNRPVAPPDLTELGFKLMGGRLVATERGAAALFVYDNEAGQRISIFLRPTAMDTTPIHHLHVHDQAGCLWVANGIGYMVMGGDSAAQMRLAEHVREQIERAS